MTPSTEHTSITIIGCGHVGIACAASLLTMSLCRELILINSDHDVARGEALDLQHAVPLGFPVRISAGTYADAASSRIAILTAGAPSNVTGSRLDMLAANAAVVRGCLSQLLEGGFTGILLVATNPVDVITFLAQKEFDLPAKRVIGTGTLIDSERLRWILGDALRVDARSVHAFVIGEHGDSSVPVWSTAQVGGMPLMLFPGADALPSQEELQRAVREAGSTVAALKGNTCFAIAACVTRICEAILRDERSILAVSAKMDGQYGLRDVVLSTPCIVGKGGIEELLEMPLDAGETSALQRSARVLMKAYSDLHP